MSKIKRLAGETVLYGLGSILPRFISFLLVRLHTGVFKDPAEYGIVTELYAYTAVVNTIFLFGMETAYFRFATKLDADERRVFNLAQTVVLTISLFLSLLFVSLQSPISERLGIADKPQFIVWLTAIMFIDAIVSIPFARLRLQKKAITFATGKLLNIGIVAGLNYYFLKVAYVPGRGIDFVFLANLIGNAFYLIVFLKVFMAWRPAYDREITPSMLRYGYPIMITGLAGMTNEMFSRLTLKNWLPDNFYPGQTAEYALGVFGACYKFSVLMNLAILAFRYAAEPFFFSNAREKNSPQLFARVNHYFIIVCCVLMLGVSINMDVLKYFIPNEEYWQALPIVPILLLAYLFLGIYYNISAWFKLSDKTYYGTIITIGGAFVTIIANYILIPVAGYVGSSIATLLCYFLMTVACYVSGQKFYPIPYKVVSGLAYVLLTVAIVYGVNAVNIASPWVAFAFHLAVVFVFVIVAYMVERKEFKQMQL